MAHAAHQVRYLCRSCTPVLLCKGSFEVNPSHPGMVAIQALVEHQQMQGSQVAPSNIVHVQVMLLSCSTLHTAVVVLYGCAL